MDGKSAELSTTCQGCTRPPGQGGCPGRARGRLPDPWYKGRGGREANQRCQNSCCITHSYEASSVKHRTLSGELQQKIQKAGSFCPLSLPTCHSSPQQDSTCMEAKNPNQGSCLSSPVRGSVLKKNLDQPWSRRSQAKGNYSVFPTPRPLVLPSSLDTSTQ